MDTYVAESIHRSILDIFTAGDASHPEFPTVYYLDPVDAKIRWLAEIGSWVPAQVDEGIWVRIFDVPPGAIPQSIVDNLLEIESVLVQDCLRFHEEGCWREEPNYPFYRWDPADWFDLFDIEEIREKWEEGLSAEEIVGEICLGDVLNGYVDYEQTLDWINGLIRLWQAA